MARPSYIRGVRHKRAEAFSTLLISHHGSSLIPHLRSENAHCRV